ncbi:MAG TPA: hypothetical protein DCL00_06615, partial [Opitutae bacterium]|nr:hypothetical protein [Opitutae bacterium]
MPVKKTTRSKKAKDSIDSPDDSPAEVSAEDHGSADQENQGDREVQGDLETSDRQLFFSTDGSEPEEDRFPPQDDPVVDEGAAGKPDEKNTEQGKPRPPKGPHASSESQHNANPKSGAHSTGQG